MRFWCVSVCFSDSGLGSPIGRPRTGIFGPSSEGYVSQMLFNLFGL